MGSVSGRCYPSDGAVTGVIYLSVFASRSPSKTEKLQGLACLFWIYHARDTLLLDLYWHISLEMCTLVPDVDWHIDNQLT